MDRVRRRDYAPRGDRVGGGGWRAQAARPARVLQSQPLVGGGGPNVRRLLGRERRRLELALRSWLELPSRRWPRAGPRPVQAAAAPAAAVWAQEGDGAAAAPITHPPRRRGAPRGVSGRHSMRRLAPPAVRRGAGGLGGRVRPSPDQLQGPARRHQGFPRRHRRRRLRRRVPRHAPAAAWRCRGRRQEGVPRLAAGPARVRLGDRQLEPAAPPQPGPAPRLLPAAGRAAARLRLHGQRQPRQAPVRRRRQRAGSELGAACQDRPGRRRRAAVPARGVGAGGGAPRHQVRQRAP